MNEANRRAIALAGAICLLAIAVLAATAQAELVTPHAASPQLITPQAVQPAPSAPVAEPAVEEPIEEAAPTAPVASAAASPAPQSQAAPSADGPTSTPVHGDNPLGPILQPLEQLGERLAKWWYCVGVKYHYDRASMNYLGLKNALGGAPAGNNDPANGGVTSDSIDDDFPNQVTDLQKAEQAYWIVKLVEGGKGFERNCFNTRTP